MIPSETVVEERKHTALHSVKELIGYPLIASDGDLGKCRDFLFDDLKWVVRYMVADTGSWLKGRQVLISPYALKEPEISAFKSNIQIKLTRDLIEQCPLLEEQAPISRQYERLLAQHYKYPVYWGGSGFWGADPHPMALTTPPSPEEEEKEREVEQQIAETHLRSAKEVMNYQINARDGEIGHVEDFVIECNSWVLRYLVIDTRNWLPGRKVLISPAWIGKVDWHGRSVEVHLSREAIKNSPEYDPYQTLSRKYEGALHDYYGTPRYW